MEFLGRSSHPPSAPRTATALLTAHFRTHSTCSCSAPKNNSYPSTLVRHHHKMEDGDLWQAYADAEPIEQEVVTSDEQEVAAMDDDSDVATIGPSSDDVATTTKSSDSVNVKPDVGPPVNIYAEAHRHAQIKAEDAANGTNNDSASEKESDNNNNSREGPHASLHLSSELKQNQKKLRSDDNNAQVLDSIDENNIDGEAEITETIAPDHEAVVEASVDATPKENDAEKESTKSIDDDSTATTTETNTSESDTNSSAKEQQEEDTTTQQQPNRTRTVSEDEEDDEGPAKKMFLVDYASKLAGAQVLEKSPSFKGASNLLTGDSDKYAIAPCEDKKYVVIGLSEDILVKQIKLSNFERYSSHVREFQVLASQEYPAPSAEYWTLIGTFEANTRNGEQTFDLEEPAWARYLKFKFKSHFGAEHYCTLSQIKVHGSTMLQGFHEQWIESEKELEQEKEKENQQQQEEIKEGEIGDGDAQKQQHQENGVVDDKMVEEPVSLENEKDDADSSRSVDDVPEPIEDTEVNDSDETEQNGAVDAPQDNEVSEGGGEGPPISEDVIDSDHPPSGDAEEEPTGKDDESVPSSDADASVPHEGADDQQDVTEVPPETRVDDEIIEEEEQDPTNNADKPEPLSETNEAVEVDQADSDENAAACDDVVADAIVEEERIDVTANEQDHAKNDEETIPLVDTAAEESNGENDTGSSDMISDGHVQGENTSNETSDTTNKTEDVVVAIPDPAPAEKKASDSKAVSSDSVVTSVQDTPKGDANSNTKDSPSKTKTTEKEVAANTSSPVAEKDNVKVAATTSAELVAKLSKRFPHASCIKDLDFYVFKKKTMLSNAGQMGQVPGPKGLGQVPGPKMEPIFAKITNEIKSVQMTQHQYEQYISAVKSCYEKLFLDMANDLDSMQRDYDSRLSNLENIVSNMVPGAFSKPCDYRLMALSSLTALSSAEYAQLVLIVGFAMSMIFLRMQRKKRINLKMLSIMTPTPKTESPAKKAATPPVTPSSSGEVSPPTINNVVAKKKEEEPLLQNEIVENGHATGNQPALVRIISSDEKENTRAAANFQG
eukprot:scaffold4266_cov139-Skeletonema_menzelii.AAC.23